MLERLINSIQSLFLGKSTNPQPEFEPIADESIVANILHLAVIDQQNMYALPELTLMVEQMLVDPKYAETFSKMNGEDKSQVQLFEDTGYFTNRNACSPELVKSS